jgi:hypothetical protein
MTVGDGVGLFGNDAVAPSTLVCLCIAAAARLLLQVLAMPPYAGLDEAYHVARVAYVAREGREPSAGQPSVPGYLARSMIGAPDAPPAFGTIVGAWPAVVAARTRGWSDVALDRHAPPDYVAPNYEAQQPSLYYAVAAPIDRLLGTTQLRELLVLRLLAVLCGVVTVASTGLLAAHLWGRTGLLAGLLLLSAPTWITLVARAGNDALACSALAVALVLSARPNEGWPGWLLEAISWAACVAAKLYTWPAVLLLPLVWPAGASRRRRVLIGAAVLLSASLTALELFSRTGHATGDQGLWAGGAAGPRESSLARLAAFRWILLAKVWIAQAIWTSGQHGNFLRPLALALFIVPWLALAAVCVRYARAMGRRALLLVAAGGAAVAVAQAGHAYGFLRDAAARGATMPSGGMEGWYVHAFDPLWFGIGIGFAIGRPRRRRCTAVLVLVFAGCLAGDLFVTEGALFRDYAGLSSPLTPGTFVRWGGGGPWEALLRLGRYGLCLPSPWLAIFLRAVQLAMAAVLIAVGVRSGQSRRVVTAGETL